MNRPSPIPDSTAASGRMTGPANDRSSTSPATMSRPPHRTCAMCSPPPPICGYPARARNARTRRTVATADTSIAIRCGEARGSRGSPRTSSQLDTRWRGGGEQLLDAQIVNGADGGPGPQLGTQPQRHAGVLVRVVQLDDGGGDVADAGRRGQPVPAADLLDRAPAQLRYLVGAVGGGYPVQDDETVGGDGRDDVVAGGGRCAHRVAPRPAGRLLR